MTIRTKLRQRARDELGEMIAALEQRCIEIVKEAPIEPSELCRLVASRKSKTLTEKLVGRMADVAELELIRNLTTYSAEDQY